MPTKVYLDQNIIRFLARGFPAGVDEPEQRAVFARMRAPHPDVRFVISHWTLIEAARGNDEPRVRACAAVIGDLQALFIRDKSGMAREELRCHTYSKFYGVQVPLGSMFYES